MTTTINNIDNKNMSNPERFVSSILGAMLLFRGLTRKKGKSFLPALSAIAGAELLRSGLSGHCMVYSAFGINTAQRGKGALTSVAHERGIKHIKTMIINRPPAELFRFWRNFENLPQFMEHLKEARVTGTNTSHWIVKGPAGSDVEWDAVIHNEIPDRLIAWRTLQESEVNNAGSVEFKPINNGTATEMKVEINYRPPAGNVGIAVARLFGEEPGQQLEGDLVHFKEIMEKRAVSFRTEPEPVTP